MKMSYLFSQTLRNEPADAVIPSHQLLYRAGFIRQLAAGIFSYLPLARRSLSKIETILREEMNNIHGQEVSMPVVHPAELWQETGRWYQIGSEMGRFKDKNGRDMVLSMTHEEVVCDLVRHEIRSYRQLPQLIYHFQTKWRDDPRPRAGLIRVREFTMKDSYSLDADFEGLDLQYRAHYQAYFNIFRRCGLSIIAVQSDVGMMGGQMAHEFIYLSPHGEDTILVCDSCHYSANRQIATFNKIILSGGDPKPIEPVATPGAKTIEVLSNTLGITQSQTAKAVFLIASIPHLMGPLEQFIFAVIRGDMEVNETKLANAVKASGLRPATEDEIRSIGAVPGYASPIGLKKVLIIVDEIIPQSANLVAGANLDGYHLLNVNYGRDFAADIISDITAAREGDGCPQCGSPLHATRGVEVGNIFKLGTWYSEAMGCSYLAQDGKTKPIIMGSYGIGLGRLLACAAEAHHDEFGLIWPITIAPYQVHLILLAGKSEDPELNSSQKASTLYQNLCRSGIEVLFDDRNESPGVKFNDADLIGIPLRLTVSERALNFGGVEFKQRGQNERSIIPLEQVATFIRAQISRLEAEIAGTLTVESLEFYGGELVVDNIQPTHHR
jgi:prolyl-tRNA synthetase